MAPRQRHITQPSMQDDSSPSLVVVGTSGAPVISMQIDDDDDYDDNDTMMNDDICIDDKRCIGSKPLLIAGTKHGTTLIDTTTTTPVIYATSDESSYSTAELSRDRHDIFNIVALVSLFSL